MKKRYRPPLCAFAATLVYAAVAACGGGGGNGGGGGGGALNITTTAADDGVVGVAYHQAIAASGGQGARTFSISAGALPAGLAMSAAGVISGTPGGPAGTAQFSVTVSDSAAPPATDTQALSIDIVNPLAITTAALADAGVDDAYNASVLATGGTPPYTFSVATGALPDGVSISAAGALTGTVLGSATTGTFTIRAADSSSPQLTATQSYTVRIALEVTTTALADATGGVAYSDAFRAHGGLPPYDWSLAAGALPAGLSGPGPATGVISGTPDPACAATNAILTAHVADSDSPATMDTRAGIGLTVNPAQLAITTAALPSGKVGTAYSQRVFASGGVPPYAFTLSAGSLPSQLALATNGRITGTPDTVETRAFVVTVADACPNSATRTLSISINSNLGRNDSIAAATVLPGNGTYSASISPSGQPNTVFDPDEDYYAITTTAAATVTVDINARVNGSPLDSVIEIVGANGVPLATCVAPDFASVCQHDDDNTASGQLDSFLQVRVSGPTTFYIHVVDWGSNARPDKLYDMVISGVN